MSKFNPTVKAKQTVNYMGAPAFVQAPKQALANAALTTFIEDSYYEGKGARLDRMTSLVKDVAATDPAFVAKLAIFTRDKFNMRSSFQTIISELSKHHRGDNLVRRAMATGVKRVDDITEIFAMIKKPIPNQIKKGAADALAKFDAYQLAKYRADKKMFSIKDILRLVHPKHSVEASKIYKQIIDGELKNTETWESMLSSGKSHKETWGALLKERKLPYMACLRNLRNIIEHTDDDTLVMAAMYISNEKAVASSRQLPFRFLSAYEAIEKFSDTVKDNGSAKLHSRIDIAKEAVRNALMHSIKNIPYLDGLTVILTDNSGSMRGDLGGGSPVSAMSSRTSADIANLFSVLYWMRAQNDTFVGLFGDRLIVPKLKRTKDIFKNYEIINAKAKGCGPGTETGIFDAFEKFIKEEIKPARIVIFSDCQVGKGCNWYTNEQSRRQGKDFNRMFQQFRAMSPQTTTFSVDLRGLGNTLFADGVVELAGWSDKIFDIMEAAQHSGDSLVRQIEAVQI